MFKKRFLQRILLSAIVATMFLVPGANAAIDETMPATIPAEILADWKAQDGSDYNAAIAKIKEEYPKIADKITGTGEEGYKQACHWRRVSRMKQYPHIQTLLFARHHNTGDIAVGYWVNINSGNYTVSDKLFANKGALCLLKFDNYYSQYKEILTKTNMCVKDPCISLDGKKVCFAMSEGIGKGYRLYEMKIDDPSSVKQLTFNPEGLTVADFEPCYLPSGDIMFSSTRCFGVIDCGWQQVTNMFIMDSTGKYIRRLGYDQVHTFYPQLCADGTVLYSRWEYNDRDVSNVMGLFQMNPDGCRQTEVFGNQTTWPQTFIHGRAVPGKLNMYFAVASGHHGEYSGEVFVIDNSRNTNGTEYIKMISPPRKTETRDPNDNLAMGGVWRNSEYPYPLDENWYLVSYREENKVTSFQDGISSGKYKIYLKNIDGTSRELLAWSSDQSLHRPVVVAPFKDIWGKEPFNISTQTNYNDSMGTITMNDVYYGAGTQGVKKGAAKTLRVVALNYRVAGACNQGAGQASGKQPSGIIFAAPTICPVSLYGASWEVKEVLGEAKIYDDGSAAFKVPAKRPIFFQVLDSNGCCIANMRSWATLMPGETFACYGCHENKSEAPPTPSTFLAGSGEPQKLDTTLGIENKGFDYPKMVQPILDKHCVSCHKANHKSGFDFTGDLVMNSGLKKSFAKSYSSIMSGICSSRSNKAINITTIFSQPPQMPAYSYGSTKSGMIKNALAKHNDIAITPKEIKILACWIDLEAPHAGSYDSYMSASDAQTYQNLVKTAKKWYDIEEQNCKDWAKVQKTAVMPGSKKSVKNITASENFKIGYLPIERALYLAKPSKGQLVLVDLRGRVISRFTLSDMHTCGVTFPLPAALSNGIYVARFEGANGNIQKTNITITQ